MNQLPLELVAMVYDHLLEYDLAPDPISEFTEQPNEKLVLHSWCEQVTVSWNTLTADTRSHVLTARLACRKLYHASNASFAKVLGDRKFRYTKTGIQDLQHFGLEDDLYLYIRTLTIGCSGFRILNDLHRVRDVVDDLDDKDRIRLLNAYEQCAEWQRDEHKSRYTTLAKILESFPNLAMMRIDTNDKPVHLGGWLQAEDADMLQCRHFLRPRWKGKNEDEPWGAHRKWGVCDKFTDMYRSDTIKASTVIGALMEAKIRLQDLRISQWNSRNPLKKSLPYTTLDTLRITVPHVYALSISEHDRSPVHQLCRMLPRAVNLRDFAITAPAHIEYHDTTIFLEALASHKQLRRVAFIGDWDIRETALVKFVDLHAHSLRIVMFNGCTLLGSWSTTLQAIALVTQGRTAFFQAREVMEMDPDADTDVDETRPFEVTQSEIDSLQCAYQISYLNSGA
jgi:hypothetical protein